MRLTIERMRALVLAAGVLLVAALVVFLAVGKWKNPFNRRDIPKRLGIEIKQEANGVTYTQAHGGHTLFKIHASKVVQLKDNHALLHDVKIELYGADGSRVDRIEGDEFEYDQKSGLAKAAGPVEITLMRPGVAPGPPRRTPKATPDQAASKVKGSPVGAAVKTASTGEIHVKTSGVTFDQQNGVASTDKQADFSMAQGSGSSMGASYDSQQGLLVLDQAVVLNARRGADTVAVHAQHAEFTSDSDVCQLRAATADYRGGQAVAGEAKILFREDGSAERLEATGGFTLTTAEGGHLAAPAGQMDFNEHNQPRHGHLQGGVVMDSVTAGDETHGNRHVHGTSPEAEFEFTAAGDLRHAHLERGVAMHSEEQSEQAGERVRESRNWQSPVADVDFRKDAEGRAEPDSIHGTEGVVVTGESQRGNRPVVPFRLATDDLTGQFGPGSALTAITGVGHASMEETTATGARELTGGDRLDAHFAAAGNKAGTKAGADGVQSANVEGHVVLVEEPAAKPGAPPEAPLRATAGRAVYEGAGEWLHLTLSPRVEDGGLQLTAVKIDVSRESGDAFAHGNVKATWVDSGAGKNAQPGSVALGGSGPAHVVAAEAQLRQATGEATFRGQARLWQEANSVAAPLIVLDRTRQTLVARSTDAAEPVRAVLLSAGTETGPDAGKAPGSAPAEKSAAPSVIRVRGGDLKYSNIERRAVMHGGGLGTVVAETGTAMSVSNEVELQLLPAGNHGENAGGQAQVDHITARGHVQVSSEGRRGVGEQLVYTGETGEYVLTGTASALPRMIDAARGSVTGEALIFHSRDDSVSIEGGGRKTTTETTAPK
jgi:lipopolysaccharide export system protein LptA